MIMALRFYRSFFSIENQAIETSGKPFPSTSKSKKTLENRQRIMEYLKDHGRSKCADIAGFLGSAPNAHGQSSLKCRKLKAWEAIGIEPIESDKPLILSLGMKTSDRIFSFGFAGTLKTTNSPLHQDYGQGIILL